MTIRLLKYVAVAALLVFAAAMGLISFLALIQYTWWLI